MKRSRDIAAKLAATALLLSVLPCPAKARPALEDGGPTASASIDISVSVAPRFQLAAAPRTSGSIGSSQAHGFCLASNAGETPLPIMLIWPSSGQAEPEKAIQLARCRPTPNRVDLPNHLAGASGEHVLIVRPE